MAPLAGKPPFATDEPDSVFSDNPASAPRPRKQQVDPLATGGARDSAYTAFDSYFTGSGPENRLSGMDDIGRGLMNVESDSEDSDFDEAHPKHKQAPSAAGQPSDKHRALYAAATGSPPPSYQPNIIVSPQDQSQPRAQHPADLKDMDQLQPTAHVRTSNEKSARPIEVSAPPGPFAPSELKALPVALQSSVRPLAAPSPAHSRPPQVAFMQGPPPGISPINTNNLGNPFYTGEIPGGPSPSTRTPQPLPPPPTPITPVFARPRAESNVVKFEEKGILRGNSEETLLPRGVGGKGDDFWRRFSMVAREEAKAGSKKSAWLRKTESGSTRLSTWVWFLGVMLLIAIGAGIGVGWYFTHNKPAAAPVAIGGSADEGFSASTSNTAIAVSTKATRVTAAPEPTNTNNNNGKRNGDEVLIPMVRAMPTVPAAHRRLFVDRKPRFIS